MTRKMVDNKSHDTSYRLDGKHGEEYSPSIASTLRCSRVDIGSFKEYNDRLVEAKEILSMSQENEVEVNAMIL